MCTLIKEFQPVIQLGLITRKRFDTSTNERAYLIIIQHLVNNSPFCNKPYLLLLNRYRQLRWVHACVHVIDH